MTISFDPIWIPSIISIFMVIYAMASWVNYDGWFSGVFEVIFFLIGLPIVWLGYFTILYFTTK
jgi:hypothetical protein